MQKNTLWPTFDPFDMFDAFETFLLMYFFSFYPLPIRDKT